jgi:signal transduction histidine kinase
MASTMKDLWQRRPGAPVFLLISYCLWAAVTLRWITVFIETDHPLTWVIGGIMLVYGLLLGLEPLLTRGLTWRVHLYLAIQTILVFIASLFHFELDFFALLYIPICGQAIYLLPRRTGLAWLVTLIAFTALGQAIQFGLPEAISFTLLYVAGLIFVAAFVAMVQQADDARRRSEQLLADLQDAHQQLQVFANQAEELAIANERTRLAHDLHDSVAQTLYGLTLQAEAASRNLAAGQPQKTQEHLGAIRTDAQQTLQETRLLIFELRPPILESQGLAVALRARLDAVEARGGLAIRLDLQEVRDLDPQLEMALYRIAQEALNNIAKHAQATELDLRLVQNTNSITLNIADNGAGFDPAAVPAGRVGLRGMAERVEQINGRLTIDSIPGQGTTINVEVPR